MHQKFLLKSTDTENKNSGGVRASLTDEIVKIATIIFATIIISMGVMNPLEIKAGPPAPQPPCLDSVFRDPVTESIIIDDCEFTYIYWVRTCGSKEIYIESIGSPEGLWNCIGMLYYEYSRIMDLCIFKIVGSGGECPSLTTQYKRYRPYCRSDNPVAVYDSYGNIIRREIMPCVDKVTAYCSQMYTICFEKDPPNPNKIIVTPVGLPTLIGSQDCPDWIPIQVDDGSGNPIPVTNCIICEEER